MQSFVIQNANIFSQDCKFHKGTLAISNGIIATSPSPDAEIIDAENLYVIPGLVDIHFHGCKGFDFCDGTTEAFNAILEYEASQGITAICPATMTLPEEDLTCIMKAAKTFRASHTELANTALSQDELTHTMKAAESSHASHSEFATMELPEEKLTQTMKAAKIFHASHSELAGINLEGPFISPAKIGAQNPKYIAKPDAEILRRLQEASGGLIKIAVVAPEVEGAFSFIQAAKNFTKISLGHSACNYQTAAQAFELGISHVTHLYNAMNPVNHREPGPIIAALENKNVEVELICDGVHVHPAIVRNTLKSFGTDRVIFISDSMEATGMPDGVYELGGQKVIKNGNKATLEDETTIAGSVTNLMDCMRNAMLKMNVPLEDAVKCSAINPAKSIGLDVSIKEGNIANLAALDKELNLVWVMRKGNFSPV